jgi:hypothetical protein
VNRIIKILVVIMSTTTVSFSQTRAFVNPDTLIMLKSGKPIQVDGIISPNEWTDADSMLINVDTNWISTVYYKYDSSHALFAFKDLEKTTGNAHVVNLFVDKLNNKSANWTSDDLWIHASYSDCEAIGEYYEWSNCTAADKPDWLANNLPFRNGNDNIEMQINLSKFELNAFPDTLGFGISLGTNADTINHYWPGTADIDKPSTWGHLVFTKTGNTGITKEKDSVPRKSLLDQNYPNPFNPSTTIRYSLSKPSQVKLTVYNLIGQKVKMLVDSFQGAGEYLLKWDATDENNDPISSGTYFYKLETENVTFQKKMILIH